MPGFSSHGSHRQAVCPDGDYLRVCHGRFIEYGYITVSDQPEEFAAYIKTEVERLAKVIKANNLTAD